ncbi:hypothetical protein E0493_07810 [Roseomonas sp. M0104]|uniref:Uncharacterized protein n=1 Tax=Teichococcus coralli TaxID=2545983 RepID=A0A845BAX1_9PROT|nr:hypothetical protein [Pseudoroseomonas coralli]MXP63256.1 hypothetical protein [Pseudoroseomonas coralli]
MSETSTPKSEALKAFAVLKQAIEAACQRKSHLIAIETAMEQGLTMTGELNDVERDSIQRRNWPEQGLTLTLHFQRYDRANPFQLAPSSDRLELTLEDRSGTLLRHEASFKE